MTEPRAPALVWDREWIEDFLVCSACGGEALERTQDAVSCTACRREMRLVEPGFLMDLQEDLGVEDEGEQSPAEEVRRRVRRFYEENPFPNYDGFESTGDLLARASRSVYAAMLDREVPVGARILEVGCGTGQLGAFLSLGGRAVVGVDMTHASLTAAAGFRASQGLANCNFLQADLFQLPLKPESFDLVICKGVLMATPDARGGFERICRMLRPGGYLIIGLYNQIGRIPTTLRRLYARWLGGDIKSVDYVLREIATSEDKARSWILDQYAHPHETRHRVDQVMRWFEASGIDLVRGVPPLRLGEPLGADGSLFEPTPRNGRLERWLVQLSWIFTISREGALFDLIGRKRLPETAAERGAS